MEVWASVLYLLGGYVAGAASLIFALRAVIKGDN